MAEHRNISLVQHVGAAIERRDIGSAADAFSDDVVWHYFNPRLPKLAGDYVGPAGVQRFFDTIHTHTGGTFRVQPVSAQAIGDELVVVHGRISLTLDQRAIDTDVVVVWRIRDHRVVEVWDIPAVETGRTTS